MDNKLFYPWMEPFIFSHDAHVNEPPDLFTKNLSEKWKHTAVRAERRTESGVNYLCFLSGDTLMHRMQLADGWSFRCDPNQLSGKVGSWDLKARLHDMAFDGTHASVIYPSMAGYAWALAPEPGLEHMNAYNEWAIDHFKALPNTFVPSAMLPVWDPAQTVKEFKRMKSLGYRSVMLPMELPHANPIPYNDKAWEPVWAFAEESGTPLSLHLSTGGTLITERGAGAACMNYFNLGTAALHTIALLVSSGIMDRHPNLKVVITETGANWLTWVGERLDEVYTRHAHYTRPKLSRMPSEFLYSQFLTTTHRERAWIETRHITGVDCILWSNDFPHKEGCFPESKDWIDYVFAGTNVSPKERYMVLGGNAAKLYGMDPVKSKEEKARYDLSGFQADREAAAQAA